MVSKRLFHSPRWVSRSLETRVAADAAGLSMSQRVAEFSDGIMLKTKDLSALFDSAGNDGALFGLPALAFRVIPGRQRLEIGDEAQAFSCVRRDHRLRRDDIDERRRVRQRAPNRFGER
jgi:hypothetical protein